MVVLCLVCGLFYDLIGGYFGTLFMAVLWLVSGLFYGLTGDCFVSFFMVGLWIISWLELGLFWVCFCSLFYGLFVACLVIVWGCFVDTLCVILTLSIKGVIT